MLRSICLYLTFIAIIRSTHSKNSIQILSWSLLSHLISSKRQVKHNRRNMTTTTDGPGTILTLAVPALYCIWTLFCRLWVLRLVLNVNPIGFGFRMPRVYFGENDFRSAILKFFSTQKKQAMSFSEFGEVGWSEFQLKRAKCNFGGESLLA